jgi:glycerol-3-phosphate dehydrogenase subunit B
MLDLIIIGSGLSGTAAACFALNRGLTVAQISATDGELAFASGLLDLLDIYPPSEKIRWENPWEGISALIAGSPQHPYAGLGVERIREAIEEFTTFTSSAGFQYFGLPDRNVMLPTAAGTLKATYRVPHSMWQGVIALDQRLPTLLLDFEGLKDFNARLMVEMLRPSWPGLGAHRFSFPASLPGSELTVPVLAESLESGEVRQKLADIIRPHLDGALAVGFPAILGVRSTPLIMAELESLLGVKIFEIPILPPSVCGFRLRQAVEPILSTKGATIYSGRHVTSIAISGRRCSGITDGGDDWTETLNAEGILLATGRFLGGGLTADRTRISESLLGLPVAQPPTRSLWHRENFLDSRGHPLNQAGIEIDDQFRPLGSDGRCAYENLYAAGSILAHQDWVRTKSGGGLAVATAFGAVEAFLRVRQSGTRRARRRHEGHEGDLL